MVLTPHAPEGAGQRGADTNRQGWTNRGRSRTKPTKEALDRAKYNVIRDYHIDISVFLDRRITNVIRRSVAKSSAHYERNTRAFNLPAPLQCTQSSIQEVT